MRANAQVQRNRKPYVGPAGNVGPVTQLKLRSQEDREWALSLAGSLRRKDAIVEIKNRLGIDLKWEACYSRFVQWQEQQHRLENYADSVQQHREFGDTEDSASREARRQGHAALLMEEAVRKSDCKSFVGVARVSLSESRVALHSRKIDVAEKWLDLERRRLAWEIKKHKEAIAAAKPPKRRRLSPDERQKRIRQVLGTE
jgi:hypothetical protein